MAITIESFDRARELVNRINNMSAELNISMQKNRDAFSALSSDINITNVSQLLVDFSEKVLEQEKIIHANLDQLKTFLETQIAEYESLTQDAQTRLDATAAELDNVASNTAASIEQI